MARYAVLYWQDYFFGRQLQESWDNAKRDMKPRVRNTNAIANVTNVT